MVSLQQDFDELRQRLKRGRNLEMTGYLPISVTELVTELVAGLPEAHTRARRSMDAI